jgi:protein-S-isoprenylcysteine O-methyltransferase Ste14
MLIYTVLSSLLAFGLAILGWGGFSAFFSHPALIGLATAYVLLAFATVLAAEHLNSTGRESRLKPWIPLTFGVIALLNAYLPAFTDRIDFWTVGGDGVRWVGVLLYAAGGALWIWPAFVLGTRFGGLVTVKPGHTLTTSGIYCVIRHPSDAGKILNMLGWALAFRSGVGILLTAFLVPTVIACIQLEETLLREAFGADYAAYCRRSARFIPGIY